MNVKQVIVVRYKYPDGKGGTKGLRTGKLLALACHASMSFLLKQVYKNNPSYSEVEMHWLNNSFPKVCCRVDSEEELLEIYEKAKSANLEVHLITDNGKTEFNGQKTLTCFAIGPDLSEKIDPITGHLKLL